MGHKTTLNSPKTCKFCAPLVQNLGYLYFWNCSNLHLLLTMGIVCHLNCIVPIFTCTCMHAHTHAHTQTHTHIQTHWFHLESCGLSILDYLGGFEEPIVFPCEIFLAHFCILFLLFQVFHLALDLLFSFPSYTLLLSTLPLSLFSPSKTLYTCLCFLSASMASLCYSATRQSVIRTLGCFATQLINCLLAVIRSPCSSDGDVGTRRCRALWN